MSRPADGYRLRRKQGVWCVRFTHDGNRVERSLRTGNRETAKERASEIHFGVTVDGLPPEWFGPRWLIQNQEGTKTTGRTAASQGR